jgi:biotin transport system substrate-specific component
MRAIAANVPLVGHIIPGEGGARIAALAGFALLGSLILWASAKISVPFWPVPMTLQTGAVALIAAAYGARLGLATVVLYLLEGAFGLPVFQGTPQQGIGLAYMLGPTGGYLVGFVVAAAVIGWLAEQGFDQNPVKLFGAMLVGDAIVFALGFVWLAWFAVLSSGGSGIGMAAAFSGGVLPFILGDLVKLALAAALVSAGAKLVRR